MRLFKGTGHAQGVPRRDDEPQRNESISYLCPLGRTACMKHFAIIGLLFLTIACKQETKEINALNFPYIKGFTSTFFTKSVLYRQDGSVRFKDSTFLHLKISDIYTQQGK